MTDPFTIVQNLAAQLGWTPFQTATALAVMASVIGISIISVTNGNIGRAVKIAAFGIALLVYVLFSRVSGMISGF